MISSDLSQSLGVTLATSLTVGMAAGSASAEIITVIDPAQNIMTTTGSPGVLSVFSPVLTFTPLDPYYGTNFAVESVNMGFASGYYGTFGFIRGNLVSGNPPTMPLETPALIKSGNSAMAIAGMTIGSTSNFDVPFMQAGYYGNYLHFAQIATWQGDINMFAYTDGDFGYIGYAKSDLTNFGYIQMQRENLTTWRLIGYRYGTAGESITVQDLIGAPCLADCDGSGAVDVLDFFCFVTAFANSDLKADCNGDGAIDVLDFFCFVTEFARGCN